MLVADSAYLRLLGYREARPLPFLKTPFDLAGDAWTVIEIHSIISEYYVSCSYCVCPGLW